MAANRVPSFLVYIYTVVALFSQLTLLSADTHSPWFLNNYAVELVPQNNLDVIASTINSTHILTLDSDCQIRRFTYSNSSINSLGMIIGFPRNNIDGALCDTEWKPWRPTSSATIKWNPLRNRLLFW
ncbi:hypothetical protein BKA69DRAFT_891133 [Paraphysoderma sedebokerense]|nr:hypothetical protein BKA69DRAFT_891133 [Paraphysoderma sedebokerense]